MLQATKNDLELNAKATKIRSWRMKAEKLEGEIAAAPTRKVSVIREGRLGEGAHFAEGFVKKLLLYFTAADSGFAAAASSNAVVPRPGSAGQTTSSTGQEKFVISRLVATVKSLQEELGLKTNENVELMVRLAQMGSED